MTRTARSAMRTVRGATGVKVVCRDCGHEEEETSSDKYMSACAARARYHAASQGHTVHVWRETLFVYESADKSSTLRRHGARNV